MHPCDSHWWGRWRRGSSRKCFCFGCGLCRNRKPDCSFWRVLWYKTGNRIVIQVELAAIGLEFNDKTQIYPISHGIDFLGFRTYVSESGKVIRQLRKQNRRNISRKIKHYGCLYAAGVLAEDEIKHRYNSWRAHASHGNCRGLIIKYDQQIKAIFKEIKT